jgi:hypothetical protein
MTAHEQLCLACPLPRCNERAAGCLVRQARREDPARSSARQRDYYERVGRQKYRRRRLLRVLPLAEYQAAQSAEAQGRARRAWQIVRGY